MEKAKNIRPSFSIRFPIKKLKQLSNARIDREMRPWNKRKRREKKRKTIFFPFISLLKNEKIRNSGRNPPTNIISENCILPSYSVLCLSYSVLLSYSILCLSTSSYVLVLRLMSQYFVLYLSTLSHVLTTLSHLSYVLAALPRIRKLHIKTCKAS